MGFAQPASAARYETTGPPTRAAALVVSLLAMLMVGCGIGHPMPQHDNAPPHVDENRVLLFGDSLLVSAAPEITRRLADKGMSATVENGAKNGASPVHATWISTNRTPQEQLQFLIDSFDPDIVVGNFTGNGFADWNAWDAAVTTMTTTVRDSGAVMYWTIPPYIGGRYLDDDQWAKAVSYFETLPARDPLAAGHMIDWRTALRPKNDQVWVGSIGPIGSRYATSLTGEEGGTVRARDEVHTTDTGDRRLASWTTWAIRGEWDIA
ncbi:MAG: hypothetical protein M5U31_14390 [Acidimicrobiia bacterium]|nr:hypothetical protein [Acidimicrobiia bacterium]